MSYKNKLQGQHTDFDVFAKVSLGGIVYFNNYNKIGESHRYVQLGSFQYDDSDQRRFEPLLLLGSCNTGILDKCPRLLDVNVTVEPGIAPRSGDEDEFGWELQNASRPVWRYNPPQFDPTGDPPDIIGTFEAFTTPNKTYRTLFCMNDKDCVQLLTRTYDGVNIDVAVDDQDVTPASAGENLRFDDNAIIYPLEGEYCKREVKSLAQVTMQWSFMLAVTFFMTALCVGTVN
jgi:hypothetical protein